MTHEVSLKTLKQTLRVYQAAGGNQTKTAQVLGITRAGVQSRLATIRKKFGAKIMATPRADKTAEKLVCDMEELTQLRKENEILRSHIQEKKRRGPTRKFPRARAKPKDDFLRIVIPDTHGSHVDPAAFAALLQDMQALQPDEIVHLGDYMDCGGFLASHHTIGYVAQLDEVGYEDDLAAWEQQLTLMQQSAPSAALHLLEGNHVERIEKWAVQASLAHGKNADFLRRAICPEHRLDYKARGVNYYKDGDFHGLPVRGAIKLGQCAFTHGVATGPNAARKHAERFGMPICYGHTHQPASYYGKTVGNGVHAAWTPGCLSKFAPRYMHTNPDSWGHGYLIQVVARSGNFLTVHVPIMDGVSLLPAAFHRAKAAQ